MDHSEAVACLRLIIAKEITLPDPAGLTSIKLESSPDLKVSVSGNFDDTCVLLRKKESKGNVRIISTYKSILSDIFLYIGDIFGDLKIIISGPKVSIAIGDLGPPLNIAVQAGTQSTIVVGDKTTARAAMLRARKSTLRLGRDCLISSNVNILSSRDHGLVDLSENKPSIIAGNPMMNIGDHVWIGHGTYILGKAQLGSGSIVGAAAVVAGTVPTNCVCAGNPAQIIRKNVTWSRTADTIDSNTANYIATLPAQN